MVSARARQLAAAAGQRGVAEARTDDNSGNPPSRDRCRAAHCALESHRRRRPARRRSGGRQPTSLESGAARPSRKAQRLTGCHHLVRLSEERARGTRRSASGDNQNPVAEGSGTVVEERTNLGQHVVEVASDRDRRGAGVSHRCNSRAEVVAESLRLEVVELRAGWSRKDEG
jgi:hypothetical protein